MIAPSGPVYQAGTLSGNPLAMAAGIATLNVLQTPGTWKQIETAAEKLSQEIRKIAEKASIPIQGNQVGTMFSIFFTETPVDDWTTAKTSDTNRFAKYFQGMLQRGVYLAPSQFEAGFVSIMHDEAVLNVTLEAASEMIKSL